MDDGKKSGYLHEDFHFFHLKDQKNQEFEYHYHDFNKIILFLSGNVTYLIEGKAYELKPWDILLVNNHDIHKPIIDPESVYERIVIWANISFIKHYSDIGCDLFTCFHLAHKKHFNLIRLNTSLKIRLKSIISSLEDALDSNEFGASLLSHTLFLELLIYLNRISLKEQYLSAKDSITYNPQISAVLSYILDHHCDSLTIEEIARECFISKYYLMHQFKKETGYTIHSYILQKRLLTSIEYIKNGTPIVAASKLCGFADYSTYLRSFKKYFGTPPSHYLSMNEPFSMDK